MVFLRVFILLSFLFLFVACEETPDSNISKWEMFELDGFSAEDSVWIELNDTIEFIDNWDYDTSKVTYYFQPEQIGDYHFGFYERQNEHEKMFIEIKSLKDSTIEYHRYDGINFYMDILWVRFPSLDPVQITIKYHNDAGWVGDETGTSYSWQHFLELDTTDVTEGFHQDAPYELQSDSGSFDISPISWDDRDAFAFELSEGEQISFVAYSYEDTIEYSFTENTEYDFDKPVFHFYNAENKKVLGFTFLFYDQEWEQRTQLEPGKYLVDVSYNNDKMIRYYLWPYKLYHRISYRIFQTE